MQCVVFAHEKYDFIEKHVSLSNEKHPSFYIFWGSLIFYLPTLCPQQNGGSGIRMMTPRKPPPRQRAPMGHQTNKKQWVSLFYTASDLWFLRHFLSLNLS